MIKRVPHLINTPLNSEHKVIVYSKNSKIIMHTPTVSWYRAFLLSQTCQVE